MKQAHYIPVKISKKVANAKKCNGKYFSCKNKKNIQ